MSSPLRFRVGSKLGVNFNLRLPPGAIVEKDGRKAEGTISEWSAIAVRSIVKDFWQDKSGAWRDSIHFYELAPGVEENRIGWDEFYIAGPFTIVRQEKDTQRANEAWKAFTPR
jgi:hypothetical protein